jgi:uncharacterized protein (TIGR02284 family)
MRREQEKPIKHLNDLIQLDVDAIHAYRQAIDHIDSVSIRETLERFKSDHERHVTDLSECVRSVGGTPVKLTPDIKGYLLEGFTALRSVTGTEGALRAMRTNERLTNKTYDRALTEDLPVDVLAIVRRNREDERRHLDYIERVLDNRLWEGEGLDRPTAY